MQLDVDIEPTLRFPGMISIDKQMDQSESEVHQVHLPNLHFYHRQTEGDA